MYIQLLKFRKGRWEGPVSITDQIQNLLILYTLNHNGDNSTRSLKST